MSEMSTLGLDPDFVADLVGANGAEFAGFIGTGQMSRNARFRLDWGTDDGAPSVVVKIPSGDAGTRSISFEHFVYERECFFYESISTRVDITVPVCRAVHFDADAADFVIALEDLDGSVQGDQFRAATTAELHQAIDQAAALHAPVWGRTDDPVFDPLRPDLESRATSGGQMLPFFIETAVDRLGEGLDDGIVDLLHDFADAGPAWTAACAEPTTLVHGDFRPDNFLLGRDSDAPAIAVVDWQTVALGIGVTDVGYLISGALPVERRRSEEESLIERYRSCLASRGITYPADRCERDYAVTSLHGVGVAATAATLAERTERGDALFSQMLNRHGQHAIDHRALDRLG